VWNTITNSGSIDRISEVRYCHGMSIRIRLAILLGSAAWVVSSGCRHQTCEGWVPPEKPPNAFAELAGNESNQWQISGRIDLPLTQQDK
jgi:hypothetical protein